jgi:hypothetical protein
MTQKCQGFFGTPWQGIFITEVVDSSQTMLKNRALLLDNGGVGLSAEVHVNQIFSAICH